MLTRIKQLSIVLTLWAGLFLLVFAVLPHHHHDEGKSICFSVTCCQEEQNDMHEHQTCNHPESGEQKDDTGCGLRQLFLLSLRDECHCHNAHHADGEGHYDLTLALFELTCNEIFTSPILRQEPTLRLTDDTLHSLVPIRTFGLRAPPVDIA